MGESCQAPEAAVHTAQFRINADFSLVEDRVAEFTESLDMVLAVHAEVNPTRLQVSNVRAGAIGIDVLATVLPKVAAVGVLAQAPTAEEAVANLRAAVESQDLSQKLCALAWAAGTECHATLEHYGLAQPVLTHVSNTRVSATISTSTYVSLPGSDRGAAAAAARQEEEEVPGTDREAANGLLTLFLSCTGVALLLLSGCIVARVAWRLKDRQEEEEVVVVIPGFMPEDENPVHPNPSFEIEKSPVFQDASHKADAADLETASTVTPETNCTAQSEP